MYIMSYPLLFDILGEIFTPILAEKSDEKINVTL